VIPFLVMRSALPALRVSNTLAIVMLFVAGHAYGRITGQRPWVIGILMVILGGVLAGLTMALGG
jgi:VIT1/CCC1 family predicted Fe2+/Mn2+ transporter